MLQSNEFKYDTPPHTPMVWWHTYPGIYPILYIFLKDLKEDTVRRKGINTGEATSAPSLNQTSPPLVPLVPPLHRDGFVQAPDELYD